MSQMSSVMGEEPSATAGESGGKACAGGRLGVLSRLDGWSSSQESRSIGEVAAPWRLSETFFHHTLLLQRPRPHRKSTGAQQTFALVSEVWPHSRLSLSLCEGDACGRRRLHWEPRSGFLSRAVRPHRWP